MRVTVTITSDFICPWCFIGERRLEKAIATLPREVQVDLQWRPFELNHDMAVEGMDRMVYRSAKFGSWEHSQAMDAEVAAVGKVNGIEFAYDRIARTPNTFAAHRLMWLAGEAGNPTLLADKLFTAYFTDAFDLSDPEVLKRIGADAGLPAARVAAASMTVKVPSRSGSSKWKLTALASGACHCFASATSSSPARAILLSLRRRCGPRLPSSRLPPNRGW